MILRRMKKIKGFRIFSRVFSPLRNLWYKILSGTACNLLGMLVHLSKVHSSKLRSHQKCSYCLPNIRMLSTIWHLHCSTRVASKKLWTTVIVLILKKWPKDPCSLIFVLCATVWERRSSVTPNSADKPTGSSMTSTTKKLKTTLLTRIYITQTQKMTSINLVLATSSKMNSKLPQTKRRWTKWKRPKSRKDRVR